MTCHCVEGTTLLFHCRVRAGLWWFCQCCFLPMSTHMWCHTTRFRTIAEASEAAVIVVPKSGWPPAEFLFVRFIVACKSFDLYKPKLVWILHCQCYRIGPPFQRTLRWFRTIEMVAAFGINVKLGVSFKFKCAWLLWYMLVWRKCAGSQFPSAMMIWSEVESSSYCREVLKARMADNALDQCEIRDNVVGYTPRGPARAASAVLAGFPCQAKDDEFWVLAWTHIFA